jgi:pimeloyl-ACP methyl ester carboxylesterase
MKSFASFDGTTIAYSDEGAGEAVVLLHGFGLSGPQDFGHFDLSRLMLERTIRMFREELGFAPPMPDPPPEGRPGLIARLLGAGARVIVPDMRGFGASDKPRSEWAYADSAMARDVAALVERLGLESVGVVGFSMGAVVTAKLLAVGVPQLRSAVLAGVGDYVLEGEAMKLPEEWPIPEHLPKPLTMKAHAEEGARVLERGEVVPGELTSAQVVMARATGQDPEVLAAVLRGEVAEQVPPEALGGVEAPVLVLNGTGDVANRKVGRLLEAIPNARSAACEGDHGTTPFQPSFQETAIRFLEERWPEHD